MVDIYVMVLWGLVLLWFYIYYKIATIKSHLCVGYFVGFSVGSFRSPQILLTYLVSTIFGFKDHISRL